jgi:hypothetical protein
VKSSCPGAPLEFLGAYIRNGRVCRPAGCVVQNEVLYTVIPAKAGIQGRSICGQVWMPAFAGMTLVSPRRPLILNDSEH